MTTLVASSPTHNNSNNNDAVLIIDFSKASSPSSSPLNPLGHKLRQYIAQQVQRGISSPHVQAMVLYGGDVDGVGGGGHFSAGADLTELEGVSKPDHGDTTSKNTSMDPSLREVITLIENSPKPVLAAIAGHCFGGGLELALGCHYRVAAAAGGTTTRLGLPEVKVGLLPGAGGTQRLPRLVGLPTALSMILSGKPVTAKKALAIKLIDAMVDDDSPKQLLLTMAVTMVQSKAVELASDPTALQARRLSQRPVPEALPVAHTMLHTASLSLPPPHRGGLALHHALASIRAGYFAAPHHPNHSYGSSSTSYSSLSLFEQGMQTEADLFLELLVSMPGRALRHAFFVTRQAQKLDSSAAAAAVRHHPLLLRVHQTTTTTTNNNNHNNNNNHHHHTHQQQTVAVAVIGAGTMGSGIALVLLQAGFRVWLVDNAQPALEKGVRFLHTTLDSYVQRQKLTKEHCANLKQHLRHTTQLGELKECQLIVEAVVENLKIKQSIFQQLDAVLPPSALLLTNTSTLDIDQIAAPVLPRRSGKVAGWHFFSPAHVMPLVEIVRGSHVPQTTSPETIALLQLLTKRIGKTGVVVGNCDGFCGNRMLKPYSAETVFLLTERGATIAQVDQALLEFGMALGPFQMSDLAGNDIGYHIRRERGWVRDHDHDPVPAKRPARYTELADVMVRKLGRKGQKVGKGWYDYDPTIGKGRKGLVSAEMTQLLASYQTSSRPGMPVTNKEIVNRVLFPLVNEGFKCLEEGIARSPGDIDVVYLYGYGFPAWRGGPMFWADHEIGLPELLRQLQVYERQFPTDKHFVPSRLLVDCVKMNRTVAEYYQQGLYRNRFVPQSKL